MDIAVKGTIVSNDLKKMYLDFGLEATCPNDVNSILDKSNGGKVEVYINSGGGDVFSASEIYTSLKNYKGEVTIYVVGIAASAASIIAMSRYCEISPTGIMMIHNVSAYVGGDFNVLEKEAKVLREITEGLVKIYHDKTGIEENKLLELMNCETWFNAKKCLELGFVDNIMFQSENSKNLEQEKLNLLKLGGQRNV